MTSFKIVVVTLAALAIAACGDAPAPAATDAPPPPAITAEPAAAPVAEPIVAAPVAAPVSMDNLTGVETCDKYLTEYAACISTAKNLPPEAVDATKLGLESMRSTWRAMMVNDQQKAGMEMSCKAALDTLPQIKTQMGC
jgi:Family of unknown function (DUF5339)